MRSIARKSAPIHVIVHHPKTEEGKRELAKRVANVHASLVHHSIQKLSCPSEQKIQLLDAILKSSTTKKAGDQLL